MDFYPPLNLDLVFDKSLNDKAIDAFCSPKARAPPQQQHQQQQQRQQSRHQLAAVGFVKSKSQTLLGSPSSRDVQQAASAKRSQLKDSSRDDLFLKKLPKTLRQPAPAVPLPLPPPPPPPLPATQDTNTTVPSFAKQHHLLDSPRLLRRLGQIERIFHGSGDHNRSCIYRTVIATSQIDLYKNMGVVRQAIDEWKFLHPLLRCRVVTKAAPSGATGPAGTSGGGGEKYFAYATAAKCKSQENVNFLYYSAPKGAASCDDIWKLLVEKETTIPIDGENGLLWRLTFFQIRNRTVANGMHLYAIILVFDHSIMDGRSSYNSVLQLLAIVEALHQREYVRPGSAHRVLPAKEELYRQRKPSVESLFARRYYMRAPAFLDCANAAKSSYQRVRHLAADEERAGVVYHAHDHRVYATVADLVEVSKQNNSKFRTLVVNKSDFGKLLRRCKQHSVKVTSFINVALVVALRMLYAAKRTANASDSSHQPADADPVINFTTNVSLREFDEFEQLGVNKNEVIGCYVGLSYTSFLDNLHYEPSEKNSGDLGSGWTAAFWSNAAADSAEFHGNLKKGEFIHMLQLPAKRKERDEFFYHFGNSNLGACETHLSKRGLIKIRQAFATGRFSKENFLCWFSNLIATVDNQLCWTISFNAHYVSQEIISSVVENLTKVIKELIN